MTLPVVTISDAERLVVIQFSGAIDHDTFVQGREALQRERGGGPSTRTCSTSAP